MAGESRSLRSLLESGDYNHMHKTATPRCCLWLASHVNVRKCVAGIMLLTVLTIVFYTYYVTMPLTRLVYFLNSNILSIHHLFCYLNILHCSICIYNKKEIVLA